MSPWYEPYLAPGIVITVLLFLLAGIMKYLEGKKSNIKEAQTLANQTVEKAELKDVQEKKDAKLLELEKTTAATVLKKDAKEEAVSVKADMLEYIKGKFRFNSLERDAKYTDLRNSYSELRTMIEQVRKDLEAYIKCQDEVNERNKEGSSHGHS